MPGSLLRIMIGTNLIRQSGLYNFSWKNVEALSYS